MQDATEPRIQIFQNSDPGKELKQELVTVAQSAFSAEGRPKEPDVFSHISEGSTVVVAVNRDTPVGFGTVKTVEDTVIQHGVAVDSEFQGGKLGSMLFDTATLIEAGFEEKDENIVIGGRTQSTFYVGYIEERGGFPREDMEFPEEKLGEHLLTLAEFYGPGSELSGQVQKGSYPDPLYKETDLLRYEQELSSYTGIEDMDLPSGDGILPVAETTPLKILELLSSNKQDSNYLFESDPFVTDTEENTPEEILYLLGVEETPDTDLFELVRDIISSLAPDNNHQGYRAPIPQIPREP